MQEDAALEGPNLRILVLATLGAAAALVLGQAFEDSAIRMRILSGFLLVLAVAEASFGLLHLLRPQRFSRGAQNLYLRQHLGLYNLFAALLYALAALDPVRNREMILAAIALYALHAGYEVCCALGLAPPDATAFRTRRAFLIDGMGLLLVIFPIALFYRLAVPAS
jgi:hypothetical protein